MTLIHVLVVDDSVVVRRLLSDVLSKDPDLVVAGTAATGRIALAKIPQVAPDLVVLDLEMPGLDGLETLRELRQHYPTLPVVLFGSLVDGNAAVTLEALALGPTDFVAKPANVTTLHRGAEQVCGELVAKAKALSAARRPTGVRIAAPVPGVRLPVAAKGIDVVAIGASTGGPDALAELLPQLPADFPVPVLVVQHMPPVFTARFAQRLDAACGLTVREARAGDAVVAGTVLLAPGDFHLRVRNDGDETVRVSLDQRPPESFCRPAVDPLLRSVAEVFGARALALVLTGMGQDGLRGCAQLHQLGGTVMAQDEPTSVVWGMPGAVAAAGLAAQVLPLDQLAGALVDAALVGRRPSAAGVTGR